MPEWQGAQKGAFLLSLLRRRAPEKYRSDRLPLEKCKIFLPKLAFGPFRAKMTKRRGKAASGSIPP